MSSNPHWLARTRAPRGEQQLRRERDPDVVSGYLQDAARYPGGHTDEVCFPASERDVATLLAARRPLLVVGAQSSLTGGATPHGEIVVSTSRLTQVGPWSRHAVQCGAGVVLRDLDAACAERNCVFPPIPTFDGATVGGVISTDAAGAATFRHGTTRAWIDAITVVLACGEVLDVERGQVLAGDDGSFEIVLLDAKRVQVFVPRPAHPQVPKISAGYRGAPSMDLIDLFIGSEGTLGVVTEARLRLLSPRPAWLAVLVPVGDDEQAVRLTADLREAALRGRAGDDDGVDVAAIEFMDGRCLQVLREDSVAEKVGVALPASAGALLLVQVELDPSYDRARAVEELSTAAGDAKGPIAALCRILRRHGVLEASIPALPGEEERRRALFALREAVPDGVNARVRAAALRSGQPVSKSGGDVIVPFDRLAEALARYRAIVEATGLDSAIWGHISDGNLHPNLIARDLAGMEKAREAQKTIGEVAIALGGSPMAEHGTGRSAWKKDLLESLHGKEGVASMRRTKQALDPDWLLAPGVLFDR